MTGLLTDEVLVLEGAVGADGVRVDVQCRGGVISAVRRAGDPGLPGAGGRPRRSVDLSQMVLLPALVEPHAHIDKSYTADLWFNPAGDLDGAIAASLGVFKTSTSDQIAGRAHRSLCAFATKGCLSVRTHVAVGPAMGLRAMEGVLKAARRLSGVMDVQLVAHISPPISGARGRDNLAMLRDALAMGATHVGGTPYRAEDPVAETHACLEEAASAGVGVDLHTDETLDEGTLTVRALAWAVARTGFPYQVTASHCVSLSMQDAPTQDAVAEEMSAAGVSVVTLPQTNLYLQARTVVSAPPRGLTALGALRRAGVLVAAGGDNVQDAFNPMGRGDPLEAVNLLVTAGHMGVEQAFDAVTRSARALCGLPPVELAAGSPADLVAVPAGNLREAVAEAPSSRVVVRRGELVDVGVLRELHGAATAGQLAKVDA